MRGKTGMAFYIEKLRLENGLTQNGLDAKAGLPKGTVGQMESGKKPITDERIEKIARAFNLSVRQILLGGEKEQGGEMQLLMAELSDLSGSELLELTLEIRRKKASRLPVAPLSYKVPPEV